MKVTYQHANPTTGGGSYLLRFRDRTRERTPCLLVDSGAGVDLDALLADDEYLAAVLLTHAHLDHYSTLPESVRDGAPVYAAPPTAAILGDVLAEGEKNYEIGASGAVLDALEPLDGWESVVPDVEVAAVPAGHTPGAAGFVVRFHDGSRANHVLFTGDFTDRRAGGFPGLQSDLPLDVDALFVNVSTATDFEETLSESLFSVVERARAGSSVLVTASALTAVHCAYLLGHLSERLGQPIPTTLAGQAAKLYDAVGYDAPSVETVPVFDSPDELLERGTVTLAGPEVPVEGSARSLFGAIEDDSGATLVQLTGGATDPIGTAACTVYDFEVVNHPSISVIDELVEDLNPIHVVAGHGPRRALRQFRGRYDERFVWASDDDREQSLYEGGQWSPPPWLSESAVQSIRTQDWRETGGRFGELVDDGDGALPAVRPADDADLEAEGLAVERFERRFGDFDDDPEPVTPDAPAADGPPPESASSDAADHDPPDSTDSDRPSADEPEALREILDRLDAVESAVTPDSVESSETARLRARVVDGGDGVTMLRLLDGDAELEHGDEVSVVISDADD